VRLIGLGAVHNSIELVLGRHNRWRGCPVSSAIYSGIIRRSAAAFVPSMKVNPFRSFMLSVSTHAYIL
jgi:hypothetical protein